MKYTLLMLAVCLGTLSYAQDNSAEQRQTADFKPSSKKWLTEANINPFNNDLGNTINQIKARNFITSNVALRLGAIATHVGQVEENGSPYGTNPTRFEDDRKSTTLGISIGIEKHLRGTNRLSPYFGFDLALADKSAKQSLTVNQNITEIKGAWLSYTTVPVYNQNGTIIGYQNVLSDIDERGYLQYGINLISGFDFYISKHLFFGYELSLGLNQVDFKDVEYRSTSTPNPQNTITDSRSNAFKIGINSFNGIRLGYAF